MDLSLNTRIVAFAIYYLMLAALACSSGYRLARSKPIRFHGEKILNAAFVVGFIVLATYSLQKLMGGGIHPLNAIVAIAFCVLQSTSRAMTVQQAARRRSKQL